MNTKIFKAIAIHAYIFSSAFSVCIADSTIIPIAICLALAIPMKKLVKSIKHNEVLEILGVAWLQRNFKNNSVIVDMTKE